MMAGQNRLENGRLDVATTGRIKGQHVRMRWYQSAGTDKEQIEGNNLAALVMDSRRSDIFINYYSVPASENETPPP